MRILLILAMVLACCMTCRAQVSTPKASQAEVNAGMVDNKFVSPKTLASYPGLGNTNALSPGQSNALANAASTTQVQSWIATSNTALFALCDTNGAGQYWAKLATNGFSGSGLTAAQTTNAVLTTMQVQGVLTNGSPVSALVNDVGYLTDGSNISGLINDAGYITNTIGWSGSITNPVNANITVVVNGLVTTNYTPDMGPVIYYPLDETSGNVTDVAGGNIGTAVDYGGLTYGNPGIGFNGDQSYFDCGVNGAPSGTSDFTISVWANVQMDNTQVGGAVFWGTDGEGAGISSFGFLSGSLYFFGFSDDNIFTTPFEASFWHHYLLTQSNGNLGLFIDGINVENATLPAPLYIDPTTFSIGQIRTGDPGALIGYLHKLKIWNRVLTSDEVTAEYNLGN